jgi:hypothetical protein
MATVHVQPGVCGFDAEIHATADEDMNVHTELSSACPQVIRLGTAVADVSALELLRRPIHETSIYQAAGAARCHAACPVPAAIIKAIEVAAGLALPRDVQMIITRD